MRIGFILHPKTCISGSANGVLKQAVMWAQGLRELGNTVEFMGIAQDGSIEALSGYDIVHFFQHGYWLAGFRNTQPVPGQRWFFSPILDSTASPGLYGALARLPVDHYLLAFGPRLLRSFCQRSIVSVRSAYERKFIEKVSGRKGIETHPIAVPVEDGPVRMPSVKLPEEFALFVGNIATPRKNVGRLIEACRQLDMPLVLCGLEVEGSGMDKLIQLIDEPGSPVYRLGFVSAEELRWLYGKCRVFCLPSLIEGVGQVAMEAMYFGARVVITRVGGPPEYFGELATYVNPHSTGSIGKGIAAALSRESNLTAARTHMKRFSVQSTSEFLYKSYRRAQEH